MLSVSSFFLLFFSLVSSGLSVSFVALAVGAAYGDTCSGQHRTVVEEQELGQPARILKQELGQPARTLK